MKSGLTYLFVLGLLLSLGACKKEFVNDRNSLSTIKYIQGGTRDKLICAKPTSDGGFVFCGHTMDNGNPDGYLLKVDANGQKEWYRTYGGSGIDYFTDVIQTKDGGYLICGETNSIGKGTWDSTESQADLVILTDALGNQQWMKSYNSGLTTVYSSAMTAIEITKGVFNILSLSANNGVAVTTVSQINSEGRYTFDSITPYQYSLGNINKYYPYKVFNNYFHSWPITAINGPPGHIIFGGLMSYSSGSVNNYLNFICDINQTNKKPAIDFYQPYYQLVRTGGLKFVQTPPLRHASMIMKQTPGGYMIATYFEEIQGRPYMQLLKTDLNGNLLWVKKYPCLGSSIVYDMLQEDDGSFVLAGATSSEPVGIAYPELFRNLKMALVKVNSSGEIIWSRYTDNEDNVIVAKGISKMKNGNYAIAAYSTLAESGYNRVFTLQADGSGNIIIK